MACYNQYIHIDVLFLLIDRSHYDYHDYMSSIESMKMNNNGDSGAISNLDVGRILSEIAWSILLLSK